MATITDSKGNVLREEPDTLEDWEQAATVEARLRHELQAENGRLRAALKECAYDLEQYVEREYVSTKHYPSELRRYERDIAPVRNARELIK